MTPLKTLAWTAAAALALTNPAAAQDATMDDAIAALNEAFPGTLIHNPMMTKFEVAGSDMRAKTVDAPGTMTGKAASVRLKKRKPKPWDAPYRATIDGEVKKGDRIQVYYYARTAKPARGMDTGDVSMFLGRNVEPYDYIIAEEFKPGTEWQLKSLTGTANADFPAGSVKLEYQMGRHAQTVEFGPVYVTKLD